MDESMKKFAVSLDAGGGGKYGKEAVMELSTNNPGPIADKEGMDASSMEVSMVGMTLSGVVGPYGSW